MMNTQAFFQRIVALLAIAFLLNACATSDFGGYGGENERRAETLSAAGQYADAAGVYIGIASETSGQERDRLTLLAIEQWRCTYLDNHP